MNSLNPFKYIRLVKTFNGIILLNIIGLALGLASVIFISIWISHELSFDRFHKNSKRIFRIESLLYFGSEPVVWKVAPAPAAEAVLNDFPEVVRSVAMQEGYDAVVKVKDQVFYETNLYYSTPGFFDLFSFRLIYGDPENVLSDPYSVVISRSVASRFFKDENAVGQTILLDNKEILMVTGVLEDTPSNSHLQIDYLVPFSLLSEKGNDLDNWQKLDYLTYIMLGENVVPWKFNKKIVEYLPAKVKDTKVTLFLNPLTRIHLYNDPGFPGFSNHSIQVGPVVRIYLFGIIGIMLLLLACINFINLATASATRRAKEIGIRKVVGAGKGVIMIQMFGESLVQVFAAMAIAFLIVLVFHPLFVRITGLEPGEAVFNGRNILISIGLMILTGLIAGIYPALVLSSFKPVKVLRPSASNSMAGAGLRKTLVIVQFVVSIIFIFSILVMHRQIIFMQEQDPGFNKERVMVLVPAVRAAGINNYLSLVPEIERLSGVTAVAICENVPVNMGNINTLGEWEGNLTGKKLKFHTMHVDDNYIDLLGMELISGRQFFKGPVNDEAIINETAMKKLEMEDPVGKWINSGGRRFTIVGVVRDFHYRKLNEEINPVLMFKDNRWWRKKILIKLEDGDQLQTVSRISDMVKESVPGYPVSYYFLDEEIDRYYNEERRLSSLINSAMVLSLIISCIGLFGLAAFTTGKRQKEIGLRKINGATPVSLVILLTREFCALILMASVLALPAGYYIIGRWLESYAYHVSIRPVYFIITIIIVVSVAIGTVTFYTLRAAGLNPVNTLREE